jgi:hypothetical protein
MSEKHKPQKTEKPAHKQPKKDNQMKAVALLVVLLLVILAVVLHSGSKSDKKTNTNSNSTSTSTNNSGKAKLFLKPSAQNVSAGSTLTFEIWVDTGGQGVNAVQANLTYPVDKFDFSSINAKGSAFEVQAMSTGGDGKISIARGHIGDVKGAGLVAKVVLTAKSNKGNADIQFADGSAVVRSSDHTNILQTKTGSTYKISRTSTKLN